MEPALGSDPVEPALGSDPGFGIASLERLGATGCVKDGCCKSSGSRHVPRPPRVQYPGAIYHVVTRGDGRRALFHDEGHYARFTQGLSDEVVRSDWMVLAFCWMPNHIHALIKTPEPNLCRGIQHWLSGYANWYAIRNQRTGHLYQDIHLNPCNAKRPLTETPDGQVKMAARNQGRHIASSSTMD